MALTYLYRKGVVRVDQKVPRKVEKVSFRTTAAMLKRLQAVSDDRDWPLSQVVHTALERGLKGLERQDQEFLHEF